MSKVFMFETNEPQPIGNGTVHPQWVTDLFDKNPDLTGVTLSGEGWGVWFARPAENVAALDDETTKTPDGHHCRAWGACNHCAECGADMAPEPGEQRIPDVTPNANA